MLTTRFKNLFGSSPGLKFPGPGMYHFLKGENGNSSRLHLRIDNDGSGILLLNANQIFHLNASAAFFTFFYLSNAPIESTISIAKRHFYTSKVDFHRDYLQTIDLVDQLINGQSCPICDLNLEVNAPFSTIPSAPYRMDLAITYRCNNSCTHCYNARPSNYSELSTEKWYAILDKLWDIGIPHIVFTGGEPTLRDDLTRLIHYAESKGQITGLNTNARKLGNEKYLDELIQAGLDHLQITVESSNSKIHDLMVNHPGAWQETMAGLKMALSKHKYVMTNTTMLKTNIHSIPGTLRMLGDIGVKTVGLNALIYSGRGSTVGTGLSESELEPILEIAKTIIEEYGQKLIWYTPTKYCNFDPVINNLGVKGCTAALYNMCIESNGDVLPCQSYYTSLGNILEENWDSIWNHDLSRSLRDRKNVSEKCKNCSLLSECGAGCPLTN